MFVGKINILFELALFQVTIRSFFGGVERVAKQNEDQFKKCHHQKNRVISVGKKIKNVHNFLVGGFNPFWKIWVKLETFPQIRGRHKKYLSCHHLPLDPQNYEEMQVLHPQHMGYNLPLKMKETWLPMVEPCPSHRGA